MPYRERKIGWPKWGKVEKKSKEMVESLEKTLSLDRAILQVKISRIPVEVKKSKKGNGAKEMPFEKGFNLAGRVDQVLGSPENRNIVDLTKQRKEASIQDLGSCVPSLKR